LITCPPAGGDQLRRVRASTIRLPNRSLQRSEWNPPRCRGSLWCVTTRVRIGRLELISLTDAVGTLGRLDRLFPGVPAAAWEPYRWRYPELFDGPGWRLRFGSFLILSTNDVVLVDTGIGPPPGAFFPQRQGLLPGQLEACGVKPDDVDVVFLTHLHVDHVGWNTDSRGAPTFPRARYVTHEDGWRWSQRPDRARTAPVIHSIAPLARAGVLHLLDGPDEIAADVTAIPTPGHLPGHMSLRLRSRGASALVLGDVAVHPAQLTEPQWCYESDEEGPTSVATRREIIAELTGRETVVACGHYPAGGLGRVGSDGVWGALRD
jgi:glyoxylase-like metal-dependent hydrolase (beta-lactamase superfamily II)